MFGKPRLSPPPDSLMYYYYASGLRAVKLVVCGARFVGTWCIRRALRLGVEELMALPDQTTAHRKRPITPSGAWYIELQERPIGTTTLSVQRVHECSPTRNIVVHQKIIPQVYLSQYVKFRLCPNHVCVCVWGGALCMGVGVCESDRKRFLPRVTL